ncbi:site-specific recombinase, phage integrase family [Plakobranchus ocellatus]|uniref:Site-specific recombinase, phage integrase family n=1 Tax=Plakobranchus ocellatus TaxID=259542 RepID=A0AAV4CGN9_9GAST|nr:site-specific recombinase, phage integrase family [Plakobranchus ocellatus]
MEKATEILVAPFWPTQPFFPILLKMLTQEPVVLSARKKLLYLPSMPEESHPLYRKLRLVGASEDQDGESHGNTSGTSLAHSTFFPDSIEDVNSGAGGFVGEKETTLLPKHARRIPSPLQKVKAGGMQNIRQRFRKDGFSLEATNLLMDSWRPRTKRQYEHYIKKWTAYAERVGVDCMSPPVAQAVNFLAELYTSGASFYSSLPCEISIVMFPSLKRNQGNMWKLTLKKFMKGVFENKPSIPLKDRFSIWGTNTVLSFLETWPVASAQSGLNVNTKVTINPAVIHSDMAETR